MKEAELEQQYKDYVQECGEKPRYDEGTKNVMDQFYELANSYAGSGEAEVLFELMLDIATAFEESGFKAGFIKGANTL